MSTLPIDSPEPQPPAPALLSARDLARPHTETAIATIVELTAKGHKARIRLAAARELLDRGWGRPVQAIAGESGEGPVTIVVRTGIDRSAPAD